MRNRNSSDGGHVKRVDSLPGALVNYIINQWSQPPPPTTTHCIQQTQHVNPVLFCRWANVCDAGPTTEQHGIDLLGVRTAHNRQGRYSKLPCCMSWLNATEWIKCPHEILIRQNSVRLVRIIRIPTCAAGGEGGTEPDRTWPCWPGDS